MKNLILICFAVCSAIAVHAQRNVYPVSSVQAEYKPLISGLATDTSLFIAKVTVSVMDTVNISKVHVKMGSTKGSGNLIEKDFAFDAAGTLEDGTSFSRIGKKIYLGLGNYAKMDHFYGEVYVVKTDNSHTDAITFSR